jgi:hypothetical protein
MTLPSAPGYRGPRSGVRSFAAVVLAFSLVTVGIVPVQAHAARKRVDPREMQAREAYAAGSYKDALDIYTKLYAEKLHPTFLRNIGRCYQNLGEPERAISSFREYLRKAKDMSAEERQEVDGYIEEMEELQKKNEAAAQPEVSEAKPQPVIAMAPSVPPPAPPAQSLVVAQPAAPAPVSTTPPFYKRAWFWGLVGGVVVAGTIGGLWAGGVFSAKSQNACPAGYNCPPSY